MDRCTYIEIVGKKYPMSFSLGATKKIVMKYGSIERLKEKMEKENDDTQKIDMIFFLLELLIAQGCAYKNYFEKDIPAPDDAPIVDGKWTPLPREVLEFALEIEDAEKIAEKILECIDHGSKKEVEAKVEEKNIKATQG